jgi:NitT/TauT family transport system permease protein
MIGSATPRARSAGAGVQPIWSALAFLALAAVGLALPLTRVGDTSVLASAGAWGLGLLAVGAAAALVGRGMIAALVLPAGFGLSLVALGALPAGAAGGSGFWALFWGGWLAALAAVSRLSILPEEPGRASPAWLRAGLPALSVPIALLLAWQGLTVGNAVPRGIFPSVTHVYAALSASWPVLLNDAYVTFVKEVALGLAIGVAAGLLAGVAIAANRFLQRGFLPLAAAFGAVPIVGLAPVLGRAFGVDWHSKAAVVVIVTFFPIVLNAVQGLTLVDQRQVELLRSYAATPREIFLKLRVPNALPFLFNALKLASVLAIISVIVAEFLIPGPPEGLGQRISLSARRGSFDVVFAAIFVSSTISIIIYGLLAAIERRVTHWHASFRREEA